MIELALDSPAPPPLFSRRTTLRRTRIQLSRTRRQPADLGPTAPGDLTPGVGQSVMEWSAEHGIEMDHADYHPYPADKLWGATPSGANVYERDILRAHDGQWLPHVADSWLQWWADTHPDIKESQWVAPLSLVSRSIKAGKVKAQHAHHHGPSNTLITEMWFPARSITGRWSMIKADLQLRRLFTYGPTSPLMCQQTSQWIDAWRRKFSFLPWSYTAVTDVRSPELETDFLIQASNWLVDRASPPYAELDFEKAQRLMMQTVRQQVTGVDNALEVVDAPTPAAPPAAPLHMPAHPRPRNRKRRAPAAPPPTLISWTTYRKRVRALRKRRQDVHLSERDSWSVQWRSDPHSRAKGAFYVVTMNVGPRGLQPCMQRLDECIRGCDVLPAVIHLQDVKLTSRR